MAPDVKLTIDHVNPKALGGSDSPDNLVAACKDCNAGKSSVHPASELVADVAQDALRWVGAMKAAADIRTADRAARDEYAATVDEAWLGWHFVNGPRKGVELPRPSDWKSSVWKFHEALLPLDELLDSVEIACGNPRVSGDESWRYMCGVAWKKLTAIQEIAKSLATVEDLDA